MLGKCSLKEYNTIDVLKFVLSVFVMLIHSGIDKTILSPLLRIAVPLFFIVSAYFFFSKARNSPDRAVKRKMLKRFVERNVLLYLFWAVLQAPLLIFMRGYQNDFFYSGAVSIVKDIIVGDGFTGSWYIIASVLAMLLLSICSKYASAGLMLIITFPLYVFGVLVTNYSCLLGTESTVMQLGAGYHAITGQYYNTSLPIALFWMSIGRFMAEVDIQLDKRVLWPLLIISGALLAAERCITLLFGKPEMDDCYFMLALFCPLLMLLILNNNTSFSSAFRFREISVIAYVSHGTCERIVGFLLKMLPFSRYQSNLVKVAISLALIVVFGHILVILRGKHHIKLLKYAF